MVYADECYSFHLGTARDLLRWHLFKDNRSFSLKIDGARVSEGGHISFIREHYC
jgi:hypothetical protein